jgi:AAA15 family ATPase/GTPase
VILGFGFKNFFSFKEGLNISFRLAPSCPESISMGREYATVLGIKGANASGKTHVLRGIAFLADFCVSSFEHSPESEISVDPYFDSKDPCEFYIEFKIKTVEYRYELVVKEKCVLRETIYIKKLRRTKILERVDNKVTLFSKSLAGIEVVKLRDNASVISTAHQYQLGGLDDVRRFFKLIQSNVNFGGLREGGPDIHRISKFLSEHEEIFNFVKGFIAECDVGVNDIVIVDREKDDGSKEFFPVFLHRVDNVPHPVFHVTESSGTKALFKQMGLYKFILDTGGLLALDEFDVYLHPHILPKLLNLFIDPASNPSGAQVIFSTHQTDVLDLLGRHRTYIINKEDNESFGYRLDEIPGDLLRNDRPISPAYSDGKIGGVPKL